MALRSLVPDCAHKKEPWLLPGQVIMHCYELSYPERLYLIYFNGRIKLLILWLPLNDIL